MKLLGFEITRAKDRALPADGMSPDSVSSRAKAREGLAILQRYFAGASELDRRVQENEEFWRSRYWSVINKKGANTQDRPEPVSQHLINIILNKHADLMDNYPKPNFLPREQADEQESRKLTDVVPLILDENDYRTNYSEAGWAKLKHGFSIKGVFWDHEKEHGLGNMDLPCLDKLRVYWQPGILDIQDSRNLFILNMEDDDALREQYPGIRIDGDKAVTPLEYAGQATQGDPIAPQTLVVDWYYKRRKPDGNMAVHMIKLVGAEVVYASEDDPDVGEAGLYDDGMYPLIIDVLFPEAGTCHGFGFVDIARNPQMYIDKLDQLIIENALMAGRKRWFTKSNSSINMEQFRDWSNPFVTVTGQLDEQNLREIDVKPLDPFISAHRQGKIAELKETTSNDVFNSGTGGKGVTAASAIYALQEAGNKVSRDMIGMTYNTYRKEMTMVISRVRQFYNVPRPFRIDRPDGSSEYTSFDNSGLQPQPYPAMYPGEEPKYRNPEFDIKVSAEKSSPYSSMVENERATALFGAGFFNPQMAESALIALEMMQFEGKEKIAELIRQNSAMYQQMMQMQQALVKMAGATGMLQPAGGPPNGQG